MPRTTRTDAPRPRNAEATRLDLLRAAQRRFTVLGYDRTTTRDIAADAGVNISLISRYFGSKDGLFAAVLREWDDVFDDLRRDDPGDLLESMLAGLDADAWPEFGHRHPLLLLLREVDPDERAAALRSRTLRSALDLLATRLPAGADARLRADLVMAVLAGVITLRAALPDEPLATAAPDDLRAVLADVLAALGVVDE